MRRTKKIRAGKKMFIAICFSILNWNIKTNSLDCIQESSRLHFPTLNDTNIYFYNYVDTVYIFINSHAENKHKHIKNNKN